MGGVMNRDYCVVGPRFVLTSDAHRTTADVLTVLAEERPGTATGWLRAVVREGETVRILQPESEQPWSPDGTAEVLRLFARVCADFWTYRFPLEIDTDAAQDPLVRSALTADGFSPADGGVLRRSATLFTRPGPRAHTMEEVYQDLFSVPWNFVPREWDVFGPLIDQASSTALTVLDLGCGVGKNVEPLAGVGFSVYGIDAAATAIERCRAVAPHPDRFVTGTAAALPWEAATFDRVLDVGALHCIPEDERRRAVLEIARVLKPGGLLYSRFFKPRPDAWLKVQPMAVDRFGLTADEVRTLLEGPLTCESITENGPAVYARASRPGDLR
jgi:SAM-dependent methyltransferase